MHFEKPINPCKMFERFQPILIEVSLFKVFGSYAALCAGSIEEGLSMLTGGITEKLGLDEKVREKAQSSWV